ncbi:hypothetical protein RHECNPAF_133002 [Rhizobium etli CNPAF512]|nr:hypothetical protein RHECNPAF_133002 [Rhizobium etli CNPAF512]
MARPVPTGRAHIFSRWTGECFDFLGLWFRRTVLRAGIDGRIESLDYAEVASPSGQRDPGRGSGREASCGTKEMICVRRAREPARGAMRRAAWARDADRRRASAQNARRARSARKRTARSAIPFPEAAETTPATAAPRRRRPVPHWRPTRA